MLCPVQDILCSFIFMFIYLSFFFEVRPVTEDVLIPLWLTYIFWIQILTEITC